MARKEKRWHFLYKTTNIVNKKFYIGMHSTNDLSDGYMGSGKYLWNSIKKHGTENFKIEYLEFFENRKKLKEGEKNLISEDLLKDPLCMNLKIGGEGGWSVEQQKINANNANAKMKVLRETDKEWVRRKSEHQSLGQIGRIINKKTKRKIGKANSLRQAGNKNSQFGTCWIRNTNENKKIKISELDEWINLGWIRGRKVK